MDAYKTKCVRFKHVMKLATSMAKLVIFFKKYVKKQQKGFVMARKYN